jgi:hypothetical protein
MAISAFQEAMGAWHVNDRSAFDAVLIADIKADIVRISIDVRGLVVGSTAGYRMRTGIGGARK